MNLYEKLNRLDDSLVESKTIVKKKKLAESFSTAEDWEELDSAETMDDERNWEPLRLWKNKTENRYVIIIGDNYPWEGYANMEFDNEAEAKYEFEAYLDEPYYNTDSEYDDYDDDVDDMLTEEGSAREKLMNTYPDDFGHLNTRSANKTPAQRKTMNDYARDPNKSKYDNKQVTTKSDIKASDKLRKIFPDLKTGK